MGKRKGKQPPRPGSTETKLGMSFDMWLANCERLPQRLPEALSGWLAVAPTELPAALRGVDLDLLTSEFHKAWRLREALIRT